MTKTDRVLQALMGGEELTAKQIKARFSVGNPAEVVRQLRFKGFAVYSNPKRNSKGETKSFYRLGTPSREVVAAGYRALAQAV
ncbi:MAG: hypothetical protein VW270_10400 [Candidatus Poseidoniales archaeon]